MNHVIRIVYLALCLVIILSGFYLLFPGHVARAATISLSPIADSVVYESSPTGNSGSKVVLEVKVSSGGSQYSYIKYDLRSHAGKVLTGAQLRIMTNGDSDSSSNGVIAVKAVSDTSWSESGITFNNRPAMGSNMGTFTASSINTDYFVTLNASMIQSAMGGYLSLGLSNPANDQATFHSRETSFYPELILTYTTTPTPTYTPTPTSGPTPTRTPTPTPTGPFNSPTPINTPTPTPPQPTSGVALDSQTNSDGFTSWLHTTANQTNRVLLVSVRSTGSVPGSVRYNNVNLTLLRSAQPLSTGVGTDPENYPVTSVWYMVNPPVGTYTVSVPSLVQGGSATFYNVNTNSPFGTTAVSFADRNNIILTSYIVSSGVPPSSNGQLVYSALSVRTRSGGFASITPASGQTPMYTSDNSQFHAMSTKPAAIGSNTPMGWIMTSPNGTFDWAGVAVGINPVPGLIPPTPTSGGTPPTPTPTPPGNGNVINVNFGVSSFTPWIQGICGSMRLDNGVSNPIPGTAADGAYMIRTGTNCTTPSIVYAGAGPVSMGSGQASTNNWQVGGSQYPEIYSGTRLLTSYATLTNKVQRGQVATTSLSTICTISSCALPANLPSGVYTALGNVTLTGFTTPVNRDYIFLINGNLTMQDSFIIPQGSNSTALFTSSGDIVIGPNVGTAVNAPQTSLDGWYSADNSIIINSNNDCTDLRLNVGGALITNAARQSGTLQNNRDLCNNDTTYPALTITQRLDMILNAPEFLSQQSVISNEVAP